MEHIKTPIQLSDDIWLEGEPVDADGELLCFWQASRDELLEVVRAVNERDELAAERDALLDVVEILQRADLAPDWKTCHDLQSEATRKARAALALVKGKTDETAPAN